MGVECMQAYVASILSEKYAFVLTYELVRFSDKRRLHRRRASCAGGGLSPFPRRAVEAVCMVIGVLTFPAGWDVSVVRDVCGPEAGDYDPGQCGIRWAYILAVIGVADCVVLAALAFVLGTRYVKLLPDQYISNGSVYKGEVNSAFMADNQSTASRKSMNLQPVMLMPQPGGGLAPSQHDADRFSEYSHRTTRSKGGQTAAPNYRSEYSTSMHNFQL
ncbi:hypothetical protein HPB52_011815 [Rhipicephalus sanguineus]|uniref:LHFPL tetraspan subfamily member 4 protein n=1 Tax=Rhipicephalus sanguineus TaxID=34632 RepID=A0A9D4PN61_RHISA|nr:hypothetical protein HPB52_011815 [Rhipicephalus sanguineus]